MSDKNEKYYLGIDAGTNSIGWCVTDQYYNIIQKKSKHLWGSRLFDEASTAEDRRKNRSARRRLARRRWRILMLQDLFNDEINKIDPYFFDRLNNSALHKEDKDSSLQGYQFLLFNGNQYNDRQYFQKYKTIYHLRHDMLINPDKKYDIRLIYLALAHMIKYRGNFLHDGEIKEIGKDLNDIKDLFKSLDEAIAAIPVKEDESNDEPLFGVNDTKAEELIKIFKTIKGINYLKDNEISISTNANAPFSNLSKNSIRILLLQIINGGKYDLNKLFHNFDQSNWSLADDDKISIEFSNTKFVDEILPTLSQLIGDEFTEVINIAYSIYNQRVMLSILGNAKTISEAFVNQYNNHHKQLNELKKILKKYVSKDIYDDFFKNIVTDKGSGSYVAYIGFTQKGNKKVRAKHYADTEKLYKEINKILDSIPQTSLTDEDKIKIADIKKEISDKTYLLKQNSSNNGTLPYQLNENEMRKIIESQGKYYPFLLDKDKDFNNPNKQEYKIISILKFKVPYYVGPLTKREKEYDNVNRWAVYNDTNCSDKITPWNFSDIVNKEETEKEFINRLKETCTYMLGEPTLPKNSIYYSLFVVLNEMNNWLVNGEPIKIEDKEYLLSHLYTTKKTICLKDIKDNLGKKYNCEGDKISLNSKGSNKEVDKEDVHGSLSSYVDMKMIFGDLLKFDNNQINFVNKATFEKVEDIILHMTALEDKQTLRDYLSRQHLSDTQIFQIMKLKYRDWGKLSKTFLCGLKTDLVNLQTGEIIQKSILDLLYETSDNLMQIYSNEDKSKKVYDFKDQVRKLAEEYTGSSENAIDTFIDEQSTSPAAKRTMRQCVKIIDELKRILKIDYFDSYFIECTRKEEAKKRTKTRQKKLQELYSTAKEFVNEKLLSELNEKSDSELQSKKIYHYFLQFGKSVYTGNPISLDNLDEYDIDHIIPQALVKDDSVDNTVLVEKTVNNHKQDKYPFANDSTILTEEGKKFVNALKSLKGNQLFSKAKCERILREKCLSDNELVGFVNRQLTMTDQSVIGIRNLIDFIEEGKSKIVFSKASNVSDFRNVFHFVKVRDLNNLHHANDAYLNIVVGNVYNKVFSSNFDVNKLKFRQEDNDQTKLDVANLFMHNQVIPNTGTYVWKAPHRIDKETIDEKGSTLELVRKYMSYQDPMVTHMVRTNSGFMNKVSLHTAKEGNAMFPLKTDGKFDSSDWQKKYGGYSDLSAPYFMLVKSKDKKGKNQYSLENIPTIVDKSMKSLEEKLNYLVKNNGLKEPKIVLDKLLIKTKLRLKNNEGYSSVAFTGKTNDSLLLINLSEPKLDLEYQKYLKQISKILGTNLPAVSRKDYLKKFDNLGEDDDIKDGKILITKDKNIKFFDYLVNNIMLKPCYKYCPGISSVLPKIQSKEETFKKLSTLQQIDLLMELMKLVGTTRELSNLEYLGLAKNAGVKKINKKLEPGTQIVFTSTVGFYQHVVFTVPED